jgi:cytochrome c oxidase subunit 3
LRPPAGDGDGGSGGPDAAAEAVFRYKLGMWVGIAGIVMVFAALTSALVVRSGLSGDWVAVELPPVLWLSTALLLVSSVTIEMAKRLQRRDAGSGVRQWLTVTLGLGVLFIVSQWFGWRVLAERGIYVASNPGSSFFYLLTAMHAVHILGGILALSYAVIRVWQPRVWVTRQAAVEATAIYWHFMDGLWVYLLLLLMFWR